MTARAARIENPFLTLTLVVGLTCLNIWPDLVGHGSAFLAAAHAVQSISNGRVFFSLGLGLAAGIYALFPRRLAMHDDKALAITTAASLLVTMSYAFGGTSEMPPIFLALLAIAIGMGYGAFLVRFMCQLAQSGSTPAILVACISSLICKTALDSTVGLFTVGTQITVTVLMPVICGAALFLASRIPERNGAPVDLSSLPHCDQTNERVLMSMLLMIAVLHAITRSMSTLGFWGAGYIIAGNVDAADLAAYAMFAIAAFLTMSNDKNPDILTRFLVPILGLMAGFLLLDRNIGQRIGLTDGFRQSLGIAVELYAHALYWVIHVTAIRHLSTHPYRLTGLAAAVMSITAVCMALLFQQTSDITKPLGTDSGVTLVAMYAFAAFIAALLRGIQSNADTEPSAASPSEMRVEEVLQHLAKEYELSPRETDVFLLLAKGRDRSFIRGELFISDATVKTHIQRIYMKFGVHSKQELITLVERRTEL